MSSIGPNPLEPGGPERTGIEEAFVKRQLHGARFSKAKLVELLRELRKLKASLTDEQYWLLTLIVHCLKLWPQFEPAPWRHGTRCYGPGLNGERNLLGRDTDKRVSWRVRKG
jgi:hypothetical protein